MRGIDNKKCFGDNFGASEREIRLHLSELGCIGVRRHALGEVGSPSQPGVQEAGA
jgi:hypothetical protein